MPIITVEVENTEQTITRRVVVDIVQDLIAAFGLPFDIKIVYPGKSDPEDVPIRGDLDDTNVSLLQDMEVIVQVSEEFTEDDVPTTVLKINEYYPLFRDKDLDVVLTPIYARCRLTFNLRFGFPNKSAAQTQIGEIRRHTSNREDGLFHEVAYQYLIPEINLLILKHIHDLREAQAGYGEDLRTWFMNHFTDQITTLTNMDLSAKTLAKEEIQTRLLGRYDWQIAPNNPEENDSRNRHNLDINYIVEYDKVISTMMQYPIMVHNLPVSTDYIDTDIPYDVYERLQLPSRSRMYADNFTNNDFRYGFPMGAPIPHFLKWTPSMTPAFTEGLMRIMVMANPQDLRELFNLNELGSLGFKEHVMTYMQKEYAHLTRHKDAVVFIGLYENDNLLDGGKLEISSDMTLRTKFDLNLRKRYHVWISLLTDWQYLTHRASEVLREDITILTQFILGIDPDFPETYLPKPMSGGYVSRKDYLTVLEKLKERTQPIRGEARHPNLRIGHFTYVT